MNISNIILFLIFLLFIFIYTFSIQRSPRTVCFDGGNKKNKDIKVKPLTKEEYNELISLSSNLDDDTKILYKLLLDDTMRAIVYFDDNHVPPQFPWYKRKVENVSKKQGKAIFYQVMSALGNSTYDYPERDNYNIYIYFLHDPINTKLTTKNFFQTVILAKLFLNKNSIEFTKYQDIDRYSKLGIEENIKELKDIIKLFYQKFSLFEQEKILFIHGTITSFLGLRNSGDIDIAIYEDEDIGKKMDKLKINKEIEYLIHYSSGKNDLTKYKDLFKLNDIKELFLDHNNYMYVFGIKCWSLEKNLKSRSLRNRPNSVTEIVAFNYLNPNNLYPIPSPPERVYYIRKKGTNENPVMKIKPLEESQLDKLEVVKEYPTDRTMWINVIKKRLKERYDIDLSYEEIDNIIPK